MQVNNSLPTIKQGPMSYNLKQDQILTKVYGHIVTIIQASKTDDEKIKLITKIFIEIINISQDFKTFALQEQCIEELEKENQMLSEANNKFIAKHEELTKKILKLAGEVDTLVNENSLISQESDQLKKSLGEFIKENQKLVTRQNQLEDENTRLIESTNNLFKEKEKFIGKQDQFSEKLEDMEGKTDRLMEQGESHLTEQEKLKQELEIIRKRNRQLDSELKGFEIKRKKEEQINKLDTLGYLGTGIGLTTGVIVSGAALPGIVVGLLVYGFHLSSKQYIKNGLENDLKSYADKHPQASPEEVWENVMRMRRQMSK
jgi:DNA repair exonuclease SbcCD ATPase subunit